MASSVQIELILDPSGAVSGVRAFETSLKGMGTTAKAAGDQVQRSFAPPPLRWNQVPKEMDEVGKHALTSLDNVRLLRDDLGIRIPRSMEKAIASSKVLSGLIKGMGAGLLAVGAIQIGFSVASSAYEGIKKLWDEQLSLTKATRDYEAEVQKTREQAFGDSDSIEDTRLRIDAATESMKRFREQSLEAQRPTIGWRDFVEPTGLFQMYHQRSQAHDFEGQAVERQSQIDTLNREADPKQYHQQRVASIELDHARDSELVGQRRINAELQKTIQLKAEDRRFDVEKQRVNAVESYDKNGKLIPANPIDPNAGASAEQDADEIARREAQAKTFLLRKQQSEELSHMRAQALEAGLRGSALYQAQESAAIADLKFKDMDSAAARNAIHLRFHNEEMKRLEDQKRQTQEIVDETKLAGLTGIAHVQMEGRVRENRVSLDPELDSGERDKRIAALREQTAAEVAAKQLEWSQRVDEVIAQSQDRQVSGFARIRAEADKTKADLQRQFEEAHANMDLAAPGAQATYDTDSAKLGRGLGAVDRSSDYQQAELARRNAEETAQIEGEAQRRSLSELKQQTAAINAEYQERVRKYQEQLNQQEISQDDFNRRVAAASEERDAEMVEASKAAREKMAGQFDSFFKSLDHPLKALEGLGEKVASEAAATLVQQLQRRAGVSTADAPGKGGSSNVLLSVFESFGLGGKRSPNQPGAAVPARPDGLASLWPWSHHQATAPLIPATATPVGAPQSSARELSLATAMIRIGSASIAMSGAPAFQRSGGSGYAGSAGGFSAGGISGGIVGSGSPTVAGNSTTNVGSDFAGGGTALLGSPVASAPDVSQPSFSRSITSLGAGSVAYNVPDATGGYSVNASPSGGAGSSSVGSASPFASGAGDYPQKKPSALAGVMNDYQMGKQFLSQATSIFGGGSGASPSPGAGTAITSAASTGDQGATDISQMTIPEESPQNVPDSALAQSTPKAQANQGMLGGGGVKSNLDGAVSGAVGLYSAVKGDGGIGGALKGGMAGMQLGAAVAGPIGAAIGAVGGAIVGAIGFGGKEQARVYDLKTVRPKIQGDIDSFQQGSMDYTTAFSDMQATDWQARSATGQMGPQGHAYYEDYIVKEIKTAEARLTQEQKAGRSMYTVSAASYDVGTDSVPRDGLAFIHQRERIMPSDQNERITRAIETHPATTHANYQSTMLSRDSRTSSQGGDHTMNLNVHAIDAKGVAQFIDKYKHHIRAAVDNAKGENSGGGVA